MERTHEENACVDHTPQLAGLKWRARGRVVGLNSVALPFVTAARACITCRASKRHPTSLVAEG
eukprot:365212-Chlamydomonas_euryale.AAC.3